MNHSKQYAALMLSFALTATQVVPVSAEVTDQPAEAGAVVETALSKVEGEDTQENNKTVSEADRQEEAHEQAQDPQPSAGAEVTEGRESEGEETGKETAGESGAVEEGGKEKSEADADRTGDEQKISVELVDGQALVGKMKDKTSSDDSGKKDEFRTGELTITDNAAMFRLVYASLEGSSDSRFLRIVLSSDGYHTLYRGSASDAAVSGASSRIQGYQNADGKWEFLIPISENDVVIPIAALSEKKQAWYTRTITVDQKNMTICSASPAGTSPVQDAKTSEAFKTGELKIVENAAMFKALSAKLEGTADNRKLRIVLSGSGYQVLYKGTMEAAASSGKEERIYGKQNADGKWEFLIPVSETDGTFDLAALSAKHNSWYKRAIVLDQKDKTISLVAPATGSYEPVEDRLPAEPTGEIKPSTVPTTAPTQAPTGEPAQGTTTTPTKDADKHSHSEKKDKKDEAAEKSGTSGSMSVGDYSFTWSGGSGRVEISCSNVTVKDGVATATIVFSGTGGRQSHYDMIKVAGKTYSGMNSFTVQIPVNKNVTLEGRTTAMSTAHWISYTIRISTGSKEDGKAVRSTVGDRKDKIDEKAPEIAGLSYRDETAITYTDKVKIFNYKDGISLIEVNMTTGTSRKKDGNSGSKSLYKNPVVKYLVVPEKAEIPAGLDKDVIVIRQEVKKAYAANEQIYAMLEELGVADKAGAIGFKAEDVKDEELKKKVSASRAVYAGSWDNWDFRTMVSEKLDFAIEDGQLLPGKNAGEEETKKAEELLSKLADRSEQMKMPLFVDRSGDEVNDLARAEWYKVYGTIFGVPEQGKKLYEEVEKKAGETLKAQALEAIEKEKE